MDGWLWRLMAATRVDLLIIRCASFGGHFDIIAHVGRVPVVIANITSNRAISRISCDANHPVQQAVSQRST